MEKIDLINKYFEGTLLEDEIKDFNRLLLNDSDFKKEFEFQKEIQESLILNDREKTKRQLQDWDLESSKKPFKYWAVAAGLVLLLSISFTWFLTQEKQSNEELFIAYFEPYRNIVHPIVRGESSSDVQTKAFEAYEEKDFDKSITLFNNILKKDSSNTVIAFYKANALLQKNQTTEAISIFKENIKSSESLQDKNLWYLALAYVKENNIEEATKTLNQLIALSDYKSEEAKILLKKLK